MTRRNRTTTLVSLAFIGTLVLSACGGGGNDAASDTPVTAKADTKTTIKVLAPSYTDTSQADWTAVIAGFNKTYPNVTVELQIEAWDGFTDKVQARIQGNDAPDILNDNNFADYASSKALYPISEVMSPETLSSIVPSLLANGKGEDDVQWAAPDIASARILGYNTDLFAKAGITAPPKTWAELTADATKIKALGDGVSGYGMPLGKEEAQVEASLWVWGGKGDWLEGDALKADSAANVAAFTQMKALIDAGGTQANPGATSRQAVADLFNQGKLGMYVTHPGLVSETRTKFPNVKFDLAPVPSQDGSTPVSLGVTDFILAFDTGDATRKAATKAFLDYFYSPEVYDTWSSATGLLPVTQGAIDLQAKANPQNQPFFEALPQVRYLPQANPKWTALQNALQANAGAIATKPADAVLGDIQAQVDAG